MLVLDEEVVDDEQEAEPTGGVHPPQLDIRYGADFGFLSACFDSNGCWIGPALSGIDIETEGVLSPHDGEIATVQIEFNDVVHVVHWAKELTLTQVPGVAYFRKYLECDSVCKVIHNASFEIKFFLKAFGMDLCVNNVHDTMAGEYILAEGSGFETEPRIKPPKGSFRLDTIVLRRYGFLMDKDKALVTGFRRRGTQAVVAPRRLGGVPVCELCQDVPTGILGSGKGSRFLCDVCRHFDGFKRLKKWEAIDVRDYAPTIKITNELTDRELQYAAFDAYFAAKIARDQMATMTFQDEKLGYNNRYLLRLDSGTAEAAARMEVHGMPMVEGDLHLLDAQWGCEMQILEEDIREALWEDDDASKPLNVNADKQMVARLNTCADFIARGIVLKNYQGPELKRLRGIPIVDKILEYKTLKKLHEYTQGFIKRLNPHTKRMHCMFNYALTTTGRLSSSDPNLQNLPSRTPLGRQIRKLVVPDPGYVFVIADYSQIELRLIAEQYNDENMIKAFNEGKDLHSFMAAKMVSAKLGREVTYEELDAGKEGIYKDDRGNAKPANFGLGYGAGLDMFMDIGWNQYEIAWTREEAKFIRDTWQQTWPGAVAHQKRVGQMIKEGSGPYKVRTHQGRVRTMPRSWMIPRKINAVQKKELLDAGLPLPMDKKSCYSAAMNHPIQGSSADMVKEVMVAVMRVAQLILQIHDELVLMCKIEDAERVKNLLQGTMETFGQMYLTKLPIKVDCKIASYWAK